MASLADFSLAYEICPIVLTDGIAGEMPGGAMPILAFSNALSYVDGLLDAALGLDVASDAFATFLPLPGSTLIAQKIGLYPFANQYIAANAVIFDPLVVSLVMYCPARVQGDAFARAAIMSALQQTLSQHNQSGGLYTIATPVFTYTNCVMLNMTDVSSRETKQAQTAYQLDFLQPLVSLDQADMAQNSMMASISNGTPAGGSTSGVGQTVGSPTSLASPSVVPSNGSVGAIATGPTGFGVGPV